MTDKRLYELINPSDKITFRATLVEAACIAMRMRPSLLFVKDIENGHEPQIEDVQMAYDAIWTEADKIASYAAAWGSFLVATTRERELFEAATSRMGDTEAAIFRMDWHEKRRTSLNDICAECWRVSKEIAATEPEMQEIPGELEIFEGKLTRVVNTARSGWWRFHEHRDRDGYCDNPGRGY